ncbi:UTRA domain-containing protein [Novosphingobium sp.]|uniref:UTRA domain-containing protein n=1 Tax=Novosphingobium sp. TaxID=1874826 RepID=UPI003341332F
MKPVALHERIRAEIEGAILSGQWQPGDRIPRETDLMAQYDCARMTVNKALSALAAAGMVERRKRAGSFVARPRTQSMVLDVPDLAAEIASRGQDYRWELATCQREHPSPLPFRGGAGGGAHPHAPHQEDRPHPNPSPEGEGLVTGSTVLRVTGVHYADGLPLAHEDRTINLALVPDIAQADLSAAPPGSWLIANVPWTEAENRISAAVAPPAIARALGLSRGATCLVVERRTWRGPDTVTQVRQHFVADRYELVARFGAA